MVPGEADSALEKEIESSASIWFIYVSAGIDHLIPCLQIFYGSLTSFGARLVTA